MWLLLYILAGVSAILPSREIRCNHPADRRLLAEVIPQIFSIVMRNGLDLHSSLAAVETSTSTFPLSDECVECLGRTLWRFQQTKSKTDLLMRQTDHMIHMHKLCTKPPKSLAPLIRSVAPFYNL